MNYGDDFNISSSGSLSDSDSNLEYSGEQQRESDSESEEISSESTDYSILLGDILSGTDICSDSLESLTIQVDNLNENVVTLNETCKVGVCLLFSLCVYVVIKIAFAILNKVLGLGNC